MIKEKKMSAKIEPFDTFWEAPKDIEKGFQKFITFYRHNYLSHIPTNKDCAILVVSCGPGYFVNLLKKLHYSNVLGIDSDPTKIEYATKKGLNCITAEAVYFLKNKKNFYDFLFLEQEINHLTKNEIIDLFKLCHNALTPGGTIIFHSLNGANPITGAEALAQNFDHYNTFTEYSLKQILEYTKFHKINIIPLNLYVFYKNPLNYIGISINFLLNLFFKLLFIFYGKKNNLFTKKIAAIGIKK